MEMTTMHIAMLSIHSSPLAALGSKEAGGMNVYVRQLSRTLGQKGVAVDIFTRLQNPETPPLIDIAPNVRIINLPIGPAMPYDKNLILDHLPACIEHITSFAKTHQRHYNLIHSHYWVSGAVALKLRHMWNIPIVHMFHTLGAMKNNVARSAEETETDQRYAIERQILQEADAIVAATPIDRDHMVQHYGAPTEHIHIIPCGVDLRQFCPHPRIQARAHIGLANNQYIVLCVGRIEPLKGMDCLIEAIALLHNRHPAWRQIVRVLLIGGHAERTSKTLWNTEQRRLDRLRYDLGIARAVTFLGGQPHHLLPYYYAASDIVAVPSHYETFGMVALEAMACGTPVIASNVGGLLHTIEEGRSGLFVPPNNPEKLADSIAWVLTHHEHRRVLAHGARQRATQYGWDSVVDATLELYKTVRTLGV